MDDLTKSEREMLARASIYQANRIEKRNPTNKKPKLFKRPITWAIVLLTLPIFATILILLTTSQFNPMLSTEVNEYIPSLGEEITAEFEPFLTAPIYIIGTIWTIYIAIALILVIVEIVMTRIKKTNKEQRGQNENKK